MCWTEILEVFTCKASPPPIFLLVHAIALPPPVAAGYEGYEGCPCGKVPGNDYHISFEKRGWVASNSVVLLCCCVVPPWESSEHAHPQTQEGAMNATTFCDKKPERAQ